MAAPLPLIHLEGDKFVIGEEAANSLRHITQDVAVISIAGLYRTGKSYLLNRLLGRQSGFDVGPTINPCTKGIFLWGEPIIDEEANLAILLVDTEGIGSVQQDENYDSKIFSFAILLSSFFIYNSMSVLDERALESMSFIVNLTKHIASKIHGKASQYMPNFLWVLRDFVLELEDEKGNPITAADYLEASLMERPGYGTKNDVRKALKEFFVRRDCYTLVRPTNSEKELRSIDSLEEERLRPEFLAGMEELRHKILSTVEPKTVLGKTISGPGFLYLMEGYVEAINSGAVPDIQTTWDAVAKQENARQRDLIAEEYRSNMQSLGEQPLDVEFINVKHAEFRKEAMDQFFSRVMGDPSVCVGKLESKITEIWNEYQHNNKASSTEFCSTLLDHLYARTVGERIHNFTRVSDIVGAWATLRTEYRDQAIGPSKLEVLAIEYPRKVDESIRIFCEQVNEVHQEKLEEMKEAERQLHNILLKEKEESLKSHKKYERQLQELLEEKHESELKLTQATAEIQSYILAASQRTEMEQKMTEMVNLMMTTQPENQREYISAISEENARYRYELRNKAFKAIAYLPVDMLSTGGANSLNKLNDIMEQLFSEFEVLETENLALHKSVQNMEAVKTKCLEQRNWKGDDVKRCMKCNELFTFWNRATYCRCCGLIYCSNCCAHYVEIRGLAELAPPSREGKCDVCLITYKDRVIQEG
eukprot:TRINITY_DN5623_c0_g1_i1.p1 TRINITY_DN5623_c0_g1~~TRINITY_DN5623_c0_g1_i1.p1  ORF type:complete len:705 (-),score=131.73 TRINITY_DN5623_c0_g1_i1:77-2191(-)